MTDPDLLALGAMIRLALREIATLKRPDDIGAELARMRGDLLSELAQDTLPDDDYMSADERKRVMADAIVRLMPLAFDLRRVQ